MKRHLIAAVGAVALLGSASAAAPAAPGGPMRPSAASAASAGPEFMKRLEQDGQAAQARLAGDPEASKMLAEAVRAKRPEQVKSLLIKAGFPAADLSHAKLSLVDKTGKGGGEAARIKITITVRCCPPGVVITIQF